MSNASNSGTLQSLTFDDFMYFFLRLRKSRIRVVVRDMQTRFPDDTPEQLAARLIASYTPLSFLGGSLLHLPFLIPGMGLALEAVGFVMGASALTRMHLYLILEIALVFGQDIDDQARVPELMAVVAATTASAAAPLLVRALQLNPVMSLPIGGLTALATVQLIGSSAIKFYSEAAAGTAEPEVAVNPVG